MRRTSETFSRQLDAVASRTCPLLSASKCARISPRTSSTCTFAAVCVALYPRTVRRSFQVKDLLVLPCLYARMSTLRSSRRLRLSTATRTSLAMSRALRSGLERGLCLPHTNLGASRSRNLRATLWKVTTAIAGADAGSGLRATVETCTRLSDEANPASPPDGTIPSGGVGAEISRSRSSSASFILASQGSRARLSRAGSLCAAR